MKSRTRKPRTRFGPLAAVLGLVGLVLAGCGSEQAGENARGAVTPPAATPSPTTPSPTSPSPTTEAARTRVNPDDDAAFRTLAATYEIETPPFEAPEVHRGASSAGVLLLWPRREVRIEGLGAFAIEVDETYESDGYVEFRQGSKVLWRSAQPFDPKNLVTVEPMPIEVLQQGLKPGEKVTWGLFFDDKRRKPVKAEFQLVKEPKAEKQIDRIKGDRSLDRGDPIARDLMIAQVFENHRLYTESLVTNLAIAQAHPETIRPFKGIVTALQRLDLKDSTLFSALAPHVTGKGMARASGAGGGNPFAESVGTFTLPLGVPNPAPLASVTTPAAKPEPAAPPTAGPSVVDPSADPTQMSEAVRVEAAGALERLAADAARTEEADRAHAEVTRGEMELRAASLAEAQAQAAALEASREASQVRLTDASTRAADAERRLADLQNQVPPASDADVRAATEALSGAQAALDAATGEARELESRSVEAARQLLAQLHDTEAARRRADEAFERAAASRLAAEEARARAKVFADGKPWAPKDGPKPPEAVRVEGGQRQLDGLRRELEAATSAHGQAVRALETGQAALDAAHANVARLEQLLTEAEAKEATAPGSVETVIQDLVRAREQLEAAHTALGQAAVAAAHSASTEQTARERMNDFVEGKPPR